jgi:hypothetical protein
MLPMHRMYAWAHSAMHELDRTGDYDPISEESNHHGSTTNSKASKFFFAGQEIVLH